MQIILRLKANVETLSGLAMGDLCKLGADLELPVREETARISLELVSHDAELDLGISTPAEESRQVYVLVSSGLVDEIGGVAEPSELAKRILESSWNRGAVVGLIGLLRNAGEGCLGLDSAIAANPIDPGALAAVVHKVARRLWYKLPPRRRQDPIAATARKVTSEDELRQSFELRHHVYNSLGYLGERVASAATGIELDAFDPAALHYVVTPDATPERVIGTMRLIVPSRRPRILSNRWPAEAHYREWCEGFANEEQDRVFRDLLRQPFTNSMPIFDSFDYFSEPGTRIPSRDVVDARKSCELSRVVVHPDFRGHGILDLLMREAISVATRRRRRYLLLECAPFHEGMYAKFGFQAIEKDGRRYYARAQCIDSWAVAMRLELDAGAKLEDSTHSRRRRGTYRAEVDRHDRPRYSVLVECEGLDDDEVRSRLFRPYRSNASRSLPEAYVAKGHAPAFSAVLLLALSELDDGLDEIMGELFTRLPGAAVRLEGGGDDPFWIRETTCTGYGVETKLGQRVSSWLETEYGIA
jgi:GNAT superfamily N-acetyltransferase